MDSACQKLILLYMTSDSNTLHSASEHIRHLLTQLVFRSVYCLVDVILPFAVSASDVTLPPLLIFSFAPPNPSEVATISTRVNLSRHTSVKHTCPVLCHGVSVFISSHYDFSLEFGCLVVWCWYAISGDVVLV